MGDVNKIAITGAAGFIGRNLVQQARTQGVGVIAIVRNTRSLPINWSNDPLIEIAECDLAAPDASARLHQALKPASAVVHAAASLSGKASSHQKDTIQGTQNLLSALTVLGSDAPHLVLLSSISVYDYACLNAGDTLDEDTPLEQNAIKRDAYTAAKLAQEMLVRTVTEQQNLDLTILRPGAVFDWDHMFNAHLGPAIGPVLVSLSRTGQVPLCHVDNCAAAILIASIDKPLGVFNLVDDALPTRQEFLHILRSSGQTRYSVHVPYMVVELLAKMLSAMPLIDDYLPGYLRTQVLRSRMLPLCFSNDKAKRALNWLPARKDLTGNQDTPDQVVEACHV